MLDVAATPAGMIAAAAMMILVEKPIVDGPEVRPVGSLRQAKSGPSHGGRLIYDTTQHIKLQGELGCDRVKPSGNAARSLIKLTNAPTHAWAGPGFWSRPEVRLFYTYAKWNDAARLAANGSTDSVVASLSSNGVFAAQNYGSTIGVQLEGWW